MTDISRLACRGLVVALVILGLCACAARTPRQAVFPDAGIRLTLPGDWPDGAVELREAPPEVVATEAPGADGLLRVRYVPLDARVAPFDMVVMTVWPEAAWKERAGTAPVGTTLVTRSGGRVIVAGEPAPNAFGPGDADYERYQKMLPLLRELYGSVRFTR